MKYLVLMGDGVQSYILDYCEIPEKILKQLELKEKNANGHLFILSKKITIIGDHVKIELDEQKNILIQALFLEVEEKKQDEYVPRLTEVSTPYSKEINEKIKSKCFLSQELMLFTL